MGRWLQIAAFCENEWRDNIWMDAQFKATVLSFYVWNNLLWSCLDFLNAQSFCSTGTRVPKPNIGFTTGNYSKSEDNNCIQGDKQWEKTRCVPRIVMKLPPSSPLIISHSPSGFHITSRSAWPDIATVNWSIKRHFVSSAGRHCEASLASPVVSSGRIALLIAEEQQEKRLVILWNCLGLYYQRVGSPSRCYTGFFSPHNDSIWDTNDKTSEEWKAASVV